MQIELSHVTKRLGKNTVLDDVTMAMSPGRVYGLWGINGSGKTMLMRVIAGLIYPTSGEIRIDGKVLGRDAAFPESMGLLLESPSFLDSYTGFENLKLLSEMRREIDDARIFQAMRYVGLDAQDTRRYRKYSLGMKQRLGIAAAIMERPRLVLLDEPTNSLDEAAVGMLAPIIRDMRGDGALIVVSSHDKKFLYDVSDAVYHIRAGRNEGCIYENREET